MCVLGGRCLQVITLPRNSITLYGNESTDDHEPLNYEWSLSPLSKAKVVEMQVSPQSEVEVEVEVEVSPQSKVEVVEVSPQSKVEGVEMVEVVEMQVSLQSEVEVVEVSPQSKVEGVEVSARCWGGGGGQSSAQGGR